jgi:NTE family protein
MQTNPLVLSGGGARGFAHLGVVKALTAHGIHPEAVSGTSAGAIAGAFLACGFSPDEIIEMFVGKMKLSMLSWNSSPMGLASMKKIREFLLKNLRCKSFEDLHFPLYIAATNFVNGRQHIFSKGNLIDPLVASMSVPALFPPVVIGDIPYVDGGLSSNLPVEPFCNGREKLICVYVNPQKEYAPQAHMLEVLDRTWHLSFREMVNRSAEGCYLYIEPPNLCKYGMFDISRMVEIFDVGYQYTSEYLDTLATRQL